MSNQGANGITIEEVKSLFGSGKVMLFKCEADREFRLTYVSENVEEILGFPRGYFLGDPSSWIRHIHPDDKPEIMQSFSRVMRTGSAVNEYRFKTGDGGYIWLRDRLKLVRNSENGEKAIVGYSWLVARELGIDNREGNRVKPYEHVIARCSHLLLNNKPNAVERTLNILLEVANADRAYIFENSLDEEGNLVASQKFEATQHNITSQLDNPDLQGVPYEVFPWWREELSRKRVINELSRNMPDREKQLLQAQDIKSVLILPIYVEGDWKGFIGFDDVREERYWSPDEVQLLQTAAEIYGSYKKWVNYQTNLEIQKNYNQAVIDSLPSVFLTMDENYNLTGGNKNALRVSGVTSELISGKQLNFWRDISRVEQEDREKLKESVEKGETELHIQIGDRRTPYLWKVETFQIGQKPIKLAIGLDISDQKRIMKERKRNEELFKTLFSKAPVAIVMSDEQQKISMVNNSFESLFGYSSEEVIGKHIDELVLPPEQHSVGSYAYENDDAVDEGPELYSEGKRQTKSGELLDVIVAGIPVFLHGNPIAGFGMYIDITDLKEVQLNLQNSLHEKQILLQEIHHRVKNNLAVISSLLQLQVYENDNETVKGILQESQTRVQTMALIHEKLYRSNNLTEIDLSVYIPDLVDTIRRGYELQDRQIEVNIEVENIKLNINKAVPFALLVNEIIANSYEHGFRERESGSITIDISSRGDMIKAYLSDNGVGYEKGGGAEPSGLGMNLIDNLVSQLETSYEMETQNGVSYSFEFKANSVNGSSTMLN